MRSDEREAVDDGWLHAAEREEDDGTPVLRTQVFEERAKSILTRNASPDIPFSVSLNPYRGCEHGCIYCFARPTHSYLGLSPGLDFESRIYAKINAGELLERELAKTSYVPEPIALGVNTDAYQPVERELRLTRRVIEVLHERGHPFAAITKSSLIERDIDLLAPMAERGQVMAAITVTTLDADIARTLEPRAATPSRRLRTIRTLSEAGIPVGVSIAPVIPFVTEPDHGARAGSVRRSRRDQRELYRAASAVGSRAAFQGLAGGAFPRPGGPGDEPRARHARRQGLRLELRHPHERRGPMGRYAEAAISSGDEAARAQRAGIAGFSTCRGSTVSRRRVRIGTAADSSQLDLF